ncbi:XrtA system polysaccharide chain length determinant [Thalassotalea ganghwensis]
MQEIFEQVLDYLKGIWIKRRFIMIATWIICPLGYYAVAQLEDIYESEARVYVDTQSLLRPLLRGLTVESNPEIQVRLMVQTLLSRPNLERISRMTDLDVQASTAEDYEAIIKRLKNDIKISRAGRENIYTLSISDKDPEMAKNIVQSALTVFIENTLGESRSESDSAQKFLNDQIKEYENRLITAEAKLTDFKQKYNHLLANSSGGFYNALNSEKKRLEEAQLALAEVSTRLKSAKAQLALEQPSADLSGSKVQTNSTISTAYDDRISQLESNLDSLLLRYTENHPDVKELKRRLEELNKQRDDEIQQYYQTLQASNGDKNTDFSAIEKSPIYQELKIQVNQYENEMASLKVRVDNFKKNVAELEGQIHTLPEIEAQLVQLTRGYDITNQKHQELLQRRETAQLAQQADETTDKIRFDILDPPRAATKPSGPPRMLFFIGVTVLGVSVGVALSLLFSQLNPVVTSARQLSRATNLPVFGIVSATENLQLKKWHRRKTWVFILSNTLILVLLICFMSYFLFPDLIQVPIKRIF